jgi:hypothetical protein
MEKSHRADLEEAMKWIFDYSLWFSLMRRSLFTPMSLAQTSPSQSRQHRQKGIIAIAVSWHQIVSFGCMECGTTRLCLDADRQMPMLQSHDVFLSGQSFTGSFHCGRLCLDVAWWKRHKLRLCCVLVRCKFNTRCGHKLQHLASD